VGLKLRDVRFDFIGVNSLYGEAGKLPSGQSPKTQDYRDVRLRVAGRTATEVEASVIGREVEALYTNGPAGGGGARHYTRKIVSIASILIPETDVSEQIRYFDL
jgi:hypothetical protein